ncbi:MAG: phenylpyruvate tautomerase MIF-related protein [Desulfosarcina sp.]|jgi:phenylpyruvate tautomerase PptA (4-oxalocrotonate tautomerase family)
MPYFSITTNASLDQDSAAELAQNASAFAAELLGKAEAYVMAAVSANATMTFAGSDAPTAFIELRSIGLSEDQCNAFAAVISDFVRTALGIEPGRVFIDFRDLQRGCFAWNGKTFA